MHLQVVLFRCTDQIQIHTVVVSPVINSFCIFTQLNIISFLNIIKNNLITHNIQTSNVMVTVVSLLHHMLGYKNGEVMQTFTGVLFRGLHIGE